MARREPWLGTFLALCLGAVSVGWQSGPRTGNEAGPLASTPSPILVSSESGPQSVGALSVSPSSVSAGSTHDFTFSFTPTVKLQGATVTLVVPAGWTPPSPRPGSPGYTTSGCGTCKIAVTGMNVVVSGVTLAPGEPPLTVTYASAEAPSPAATATFQASAIQYPGTEFSQPQPVTPASVIVTCNDGVGTVSVSPSSVTAGTTTTLTFTYTAAECVLGQGSQVSLVVPPGWTPPSLKGPDGYTTSSLFSPPSVSGRTITVGLRQRGAFVKPGMTLTITYAMAVPPASPGAFTFSASEQTTGVGALTPLTVSPQVTVVPQAVSPQATVSPQAIAPSSGHSAGASPTVAASPAADAGGVARPLLIVLAALAALIALAAGGTLTLRRLRPRAAATPSVRAEPHPGPPASAAIRDTGPAVTLTVRIEPHRDPATTVIEEARP